MTYTLRHVDPAWRGDCVRGVLESIRLGYASQDVNGQCLKDHVFAAAHWGKVGPKGSVNPWHGGGVKAGTAMSAITSKQWVQMLPNTRGAPERPALLTDIIAAVAKAGQGGKFYPFFEIKPGTGSHDAAPYTHLKASAVAHRVPCAVTTIQSYGSTAKAKAAWEASAKLRMKAAAGLPRMLLWRHSIPANSDWWDLLEAVKGAPASQKMPAHIIRVPNSSTHAAARKTLAKVAATVDWTPVAPAPPTPPEVPVTSPLRVDGVDLSHFQSGTLDFAAFKKAGGRFVIHKAGEGTSVTDALYVKRRAEVAKAGLVFGSYWYAHPDSSSGTVQAAKFLAVAKPQPGDLRPALDLETNGGLTTARLTAWVGAFVAEVKRQLGVGPIVYTNQNLTNAFGCPLWVARYSNANAAPVIPKPWTKATIRQFSNGVYGVPKTAAGLGAVDLDTLPGGVASLTALLIGAGGSDELDDADRAWITDAIDKGVAEYVGDIVAAPSAANPRNKIWLATALERLLAARKP